MTTIELNVTGAHISANVNDHLTEGMTGVRVYIQYDEAWDGLVKTLVCRSAVDNLCCDEVRTVLNIGTEATVAHEVMIAGRTLLLGIEGRSSDGTEIFPTIWADCGKIQEGANAGADPTAEATPEMWEQLLAQMGSLSSLNTENKENLVEAINEAMTKCQGIPGKDGRGIADIQGNYNGSWTFVLDDGTSISVGNKAYVSLVYQLRSLQVEFADKASVSPEFANSISECTDAGKLYVLPDGYIYAHMAHEEYPFTNRISASVDLDGSAYNGGQGWKSGYRVNSSGVELEASDSCVTGFIAVTKGDVLRFKGISYAPGVDGTGNISVYDSSFNHIASAYSLNFDTMDHLVGSYTVDEETGYITSAVVNDRYDDGVAYIRMTVANLDGSEVITVNEEITGETETTYAWTNTGHAFLQGDYQDRIVTMEEQIALLGEGNNALIPDYVVTEAEAVIDRVIAAQGDRTFTFAALTDMHYENGGYADGVIHACQALKYIDRRVKLDAVAVLGDYTDGYPDSGYDNAIEDFKAVNNVLDGLRFAPNLRLAGNHDIYSENPALTMRYINGYSDDVVWGSRSGGYYYRDFDGYRIRVIGLNTSIVSMDQYNWFVSALDLSDKDDVADWSILILSHHPLDWYPGDEVYRYCYILDAYKNGTSGETEGVAYNFSDGKNAAKLIGNIHGHIHNFKVDYIHFGNVIGNEKSDVLRVATPNACYNRENEYEGAWADDTAYNKTLNAAGDTSFCIYCIDLDACTIKAICYGAGYDREIDYAYTNDVTPPEKAVMDTETWTFELEDGSTVTKQVVVMV